MVKKGKKVTIKSDCSYWNGREGILIAKVKDTYIDGLKRRRTTDYIVQFPKEWSYFKRKEIGGLK